MSYQPKICPECKRAFTPCSGIQKTCGNPECKTARARRLYREKNNVQTKRRTCICGKEFTTNHPRQKTCGNKECQKARSRETKKTLKEMKADAGELPKPMNIRRDIPWNLKHDPFQDITAPVTGLPGNHAQYAPLG